MIASNSAPRHETSQGRQKNGRVGVRKEGREKCHTFLGTNLRGETAATPFLSLPSRSSSVFLLNILRHAARFTVLLIRQRQLVSKDTLYINFGYCGGGGGGPPPAFLRRCCSTPARLASFVVLRFLGYSGGDSL